MSKKGLIKVGWLFLAVLVTVPLVVTYNPTSNRDNDIMLVYALLALTFPIGIAIAALHALVGYILEVVFSAQLPGTPRDDPRLCCFLDCWIPAVVRCHTCHLENAEKDEKYGLIRGCC